MKCYLDSKDTGTSPSHLAKYREQYLIMAIQTMGDAWAASCRSSTHLPGHLDAQCKSELDFLSFLPVHCWALYVLLIFTILFKLFLILFDIFVN